MRTYIPIAIQRLVRERFANCCAYCQTAEMLTATTFEFEHIIPRAAGGETVFANLCLSCPMCNRYKADSVSAVDPVTQTEVPLFHPQQQAWRDHFAWSENGTEIIGLTPNGRASLAALHMNRAAMIRVRRMWVAMAEHPPMLE
jgi:hypothetical protein